MKVRLLGFALVLLLFHFHSNAVAIVDQEHVPLATNGVANVGASNTIDWAQTFTVGVTGKLTGFDIWMDRQTTTTLPLLFDIRKTSAGGIPTEPDVGSSILASGQVDATVFQTGDDDAFITPATLPHIDLSSFSVMVNAGDVLALALQTDAPGAESGRAYNWYNTFDEYPNGRAYVRFDATGWHYRDPPDFDLVFRTYVTPIPEPTTIALLGLLATLVSTLRRRGDHRSMNRVSVTSACRYSVHGPGRKPWVDDAFLRSERPPSVMPAEEMSFRGAVAVPKSYRIDEF